MASPTASPIPSLPLLAVAILLLSGLTAAAPSRLSKTCATADGPHLIRIGVAAALGIDVKEIWRFYYVYCT